MPLFTCLFGVGGGDHLRVYKIHMGSQSFHKQLRVTCYGVFSDLAGILRDILLVVCILGIKKLKIG